MEPTNIFLRTYGFFMDGKFSPEINQCAYDYIKFVGGSGERREITGIRKIILAKVLSTWLSEKPSIYKPLFSG